MARIRSVHPGLFTDEAFMGASAMARIMLIGLWTEAWDDGVFEWKPVVLKARIFPADNVDANELLSELVEQNCIKLVEYGGKKYGLIRNFRKFQRPKTPNSSGVLENQDKKYVGLPSDVSEPFPNHFPNASEKPIQMEDGGGRMDEKGKVEIGGGGSARARLNEIEFELRKANGCENSVSPRLADLSPILGLVDAGYDLETEILPSIRAKPYPEAKTWGYFVPQVKRSRADRLAAKNAPEPQAREGPRPRHGGKSIKQIIAEQLAECENEPNSSDQGDRGNLVQLPFGGKF
jgi:hypothetical protein